MFKLKTDNIEWTKTATGHNERKNLEIFLDLCYKFQLQRFKKQSFYIFLDLFRQ